MLENQHFSMFSPRVKYQLRTILFVQLVCISFIEIQIVHLKTCSMFSSEPETARAQVPDERWEHLCQSYKPKKCTPAFLNVTDIAGLIKGASEGKGLGNKFLSNISAVDGIYHVVRIFEDEDIVHVEGNVDPIRDLEVVTTELRLKDLEVLNSHKEGLERVVARTNDKAKKFELVCTIVSFYTLQYIIYCNVFSRKQ